MYSENTNLLRNHFRQPTKFQIEMAVVAYSPVYGRGCVFFSPTTSGNSKVNTVVACFSPTPTIIPKV